MRDEPPEPVSDLEQEGVPDMEGGYPGEAATGLRWDEVLAPGDEPVAAEDFGVTAAEERADEPLAVRVRREEPDAALGEGLGAGDATPSRLADPDAVVDDEADMVGGEAVNDAGARSPEEAAVQVVAEDEARGLNWDADPGYLDDEEASGDAGGAAGAGRPGP